jgi:hypothetical protein
MADENSSLSCEVALAVQFSNFFVGNSFEASCRGLPDEAHLRFETKLRWAGPPCTILEFEYCFEAGSRACPTKPAEDIGFEKESCKTKPAFVSRDFGGRSRGEKIRTSDLHVPNVAR